MTRTAVALDRATALLIGLLLAAAGAGVVLWHYDRLPGVPRTVSVDSVVEMTRSGWWPWALITAGILFVLVGARWLISHRPAPRVNDHLLPGTATSERLSVDLTSIADAVADVVGAHPAVRSAKATTVRDRGRVTLALKVTADAPASLGGVIVATDEAARTAVTMIGDASIAVVTTLDVRRGRARTVA